MTNSEMQLATSGSDVLSHRNDTVAAHEAAEYMEKSGKAVRHKARIMKALSLQQGMTGAEIGDATGLGHVEAQRRISELVAKELLEYRGKRNCRIKGTPMSEVYFTKDGADVMNVKYIGAFQ